MLEQISVVMSGLWNPYSDQKAEITYSNTEQIILQLSPTAQFNRQIHPLAYLQDIREKLLLQESEL